MNKERLTQLALPARKLLSLRAGQGRLLIYPHLHADGDACGSAFALTSLLRKCDIAAFCVLNEAVEPDYAFLPGAEEALVWPELGPEEKETLRREQAAALMIDVSEPERLDLRRSLYEAAPVQYILDHHVSEEPNDDYRYVYTEAAATCELTAELALALERESGKKLMTQEEALCLYTGILTDTGNFSYQNVSPDTLRTAAYLLSFGIDLPELTNRLFRVQSWQRYRIEGRLRLETKRCCGGAITYLALPAELLRKLGAEDGDLDAMPSILRDVKGTKLALMLRETPEGSIRGNLRSQSGYNVREVAARFGGGGHVNAAGFTLKDISLEAGLEALLEALKEELINGEKKERE